MTGHAVAVMGLDATEWIWVLNAVLLLILLLTLLFIYQTQRLRISLSKVALIENARARLLALARPDEALRVWGEVLGMAEITGRVVMRDMMVALYSAKIGYPDTLRAAVRGIVNEVNRVAADLDEGLYSSWELLGGSAAAHLRLIEVMAIAEPVVWYEALVSGRGRWGYRSVSLLDIARRVAAYSDAPALAGKIDVSVDGKKTISAKAASSDCPTRFSRFLLNALPPRINRRSKIAQRKYARTLLEELRSLGVLPEEIRSEVVPW